MTFGYLSVAMLLLMVGGPSKSTELLSRAVQQFRAKNYTVAHRLLVRLIQISPRDAPAYNLLGQVFMKEGKYTKAAYEFGYILKFQPDSADAHVNLGDALTDLNRNDSARQEYMKALRIQPDEPLALYGIGVGYARVHDDRAALRFLGRAHQLDPRSVRVSSALAAVYIELKMFAEATSLESKLRGAGSTARHDIYSLAILAMAEGHPGLGARFIIHSPELSKRYYSASCQWAADQIGKSAYSAALHTLKAVSQFRPQTATYHELLGAAYYKLNNPKLAVSELQDAINLDPSNPDYYSELGMVFLKHDTADGAIVVFHAGVRAQPRSAQMWVGLGLSYYMEGENGAAKKALEHAISLNSNYAPAYIVLCGLLSWSGQDMELKQIIGKALALAPHNYLLPYYYGMTLEHGESKGAASQFRKAIALNRRFPWSYFQLGKLLARRGDSSQAIHAFKQCLDINPKIASAHYQLFRIYRREGEQKLATDNLDEFLKLRKKFGEYGDKTVQRLVFTLQR